MVAQSETETDLLSFPPDVGWRRQLQPASARRHPGKLDLLFLDYLLRRYTRPGDVLLDPMAGCGSLLQATLPPYGCHVTLNELEAQWCEQIAQTWAHLQRSLVTSTGTARILCGDARDLPGRIAGGADLLLTSPPYADAFGPGPIGAGLARYLADDPRNGASSQVAHPHYDALVTSPPYLNALSGQRHVIDTTLIGKDGPRSAESRHALRQGYAPDQRNPAQIGNLAGARYQAAMAAVYTACIPLVRSDGLVILVIKNVVRDNAEVDLIGAARAQCEALGCCYVTTHWRAVRVGPFHAIRRKSRPDALIIDREAALVLRRD